jgi:hypothetical protein
VDGGGIGGAFVIFLIAEFMGSSGEGLFLSLGNRFIVCPFTGAGVPFGDDCEKSTGFSGLSPEKLSSEGEIVTRVFSDSGVC